MHRPLRSALVAALLLAPAACATANTAAPENATPTAQQPRVRRDANRIGSDELQAADQTDLLSLVQAHRPAWLRQRGKSSMRSAEYVKVYQDGIRLGGPGALRQIATRSVSEIRYLDGMTATQRFGTDHGNGAILVSTRN